MSTRKFHVVYQVEDVTGNIEATGLFPEGLLRQEDIQRLCDMIRRAREMDKEKPVLILNLIELAT